MATLEKTPIWLELKKEYMLSNMLYQIIEINYETT